LSLSVNEAVESAYRDGILTTTSLMVGAPAAADAVMRAQRLPGLRVGLHLVVIEGPAILPRRLIPDLVGSDGQFPSDQATLGVRYYFSLAARRQLRAEIKAQFAAFAATGLRLDHANAHKHMHLHPTVGRLLIEEGRPYGLPAIRVPAEPPDIMAALGQRPNLADRTLFQWTRVLRAQAHRAGLRTNDHVFGLGWTGHMTAERLLRLAAVLPPGLSEIYFHPATKGDASLSALMPGYEHAAEFATLLDPAVAAAFPNRVTYG
jgi:hopanoid biosynthesis associated protein HpnK